MSRRPASRLRNVLAASLASLALGGCGGDGRDAPAPPPIAATKPAEQEQPASAEPSALTPVAEQTPAPAAPVQIPPDATAKARPPAAEPAPTPSTSLPGAIPPAPAPDPNAQPPQAPPDPLQWLRDSQARKADYLRRVGEAEANAENARTKAEEWQRNVLAFKNPFLARPQLSPDDAAAIAGMGGAERVHWAEARLADAMAASNAAQKALDDLKANPPLN
jgi:hypothetical protein